VRTPIAGLHHVTALSGPAAGTAGFHAGVLGLRLVKRTVNFDDPGGWHLYFGDASGAPGTLVTCFPRTGAPAGRRGAGEVAATALAVPAGALAWWRTRLASHGVVAEEAQRFGERLLAFDAPDGMRLELVESAAAGPGVPWSGGGVAVEHAIRGLHSVTLAFGDAGRSAALLRDGMGFRESGREGVRVRLCAAGGGPSAWVDLVSLPGGARASLGAGSVHHVAFRVAGEAAQDAWREALAGQGMRVTEAMDRNYFRSVYFREPGGVLFELATDPPGFTVDESPATLGSRLMLPAWLEPMRGRIEAALPALDAPAPEPSR
jgi:glyoxalase family protein